MAGELVEYVSTMELSSLSTVTETTNCTGSRDIVEVVLQSMR